MRAPLTTDITAATTGHAALHNEERSRLNFHEQDITTLQVAVGASSTSSNLPRTPTVLTAEAAADGAVLLTPDRTADQQTDVDVEWSLAAGTRSWQSVLHSPTGLVTSFLIPAGVLAPNFSYVTRLRLRNAFGAGGWAESAAFGVLGATAQADLVPVGAVASLADGTVVASPVSGVAYRLRYSLRNDGAAPSEAGKVHSAGARLVDGTLLPYSDTYTSSVAAGATVMLPATNAGGPAGDGTFTFGAPGDYPVTVFWNDFTPRRVLEARYDNNQATVLLKVIATASVLVSDDGTGANGALLSARSTPVGGKPWAVSGTSPTILNNKIRTPTGDVYAWYDPGATSYRHGANLGVKGDRHVIVSVTDQNTFVSVGEGQLLKRITGGYTLLMDFTEPAAVNVTLEVEKIRINATSATYKVFVNGLQVQLTPPGGGTPVDSVVITDAALTGDMVGFRSYGSTFDLDDFVTKNPGAGGGGTGTVAPTVGVWDLGRRTALAFSETNAWSLHANYDSLAHIGNVIIPAMIDAKVRIYRDGFGNNQASRDKITELYTRTGARGVFTVDPRDGWANPAQWVTWITTLPAGAVLAGEGPNEMDEPSNASVAYQGVSLAANNYAQLKVWQRELYDALTTAQAPGGALYGRQPVYAFAPSFADSRKQEAAGAFAAHVNVMHNYQGGRPPDDQLDADAWEMRGDRGPGGWYGAAMTAGAGRPVVATESGWHLLDDIVGQGGITIGAAKKYGIRLYLDFWWHSLRRNNRMLVCLYNVEGQYGAANGWGIFLPKTDTRSAAYEAARAFWALVADLGAEYATVAWGGSVNGVTAPFGAVGGGAAISGSSGSPGKDQLRWFSLSRRDGSFQVLLWKNSQSSSSGAGRMDLTVAATTATVTLPTAKAATVYRPASAGVSGTTLTSATSYVLQVTDDPVVLHIAA